MTQPSKKPAASYYKGVRLTITAGPSDRPAVVSVAVKHQTGRWDDWNLLFPAFRVPLTNVEDYRGVLTIVIRTVEAMLEADEKFV